jgi:hypothetical protein
MENIIIILFIVVIIIYLIYMNSKNNELELFTNPNCGSWANNGECDKNPGYMVPNCPNECRYKCINFANTGECENHYKCISWANAGECEKNPGWMLPNCPNECNKNTTVPTTPLPNNTLLPIVINTSMGQSNNSIINFKELTVKENPAGGWNVWINAPLEINHNVSIPGRWGGNIKTTIDTMWNITVTYSSPDEWPMKQHDTYGWMKIETDLQSGTNLTTYNTNCCGGYSLDKYYMMRKKNWDGGPSPQQPITISQSNNSNKLTFRNKENFVKISANIVGYYADKKRDSMEINILDTLTFGSTNTAT